MTDVNQELVRALKLLSTQYEQQFGEVSQQIAELGEQIILLTNSPTKDLKSKSSNSSVDLMQSVEVSACKSCENAMFFRVDNDSDTLFDCLITSAVTSPVFSCSQRKIASED